MDLKKIAQSILDAEIPLPYNSPHLYIFKNDKGVGIRQVSRGVQLYAFWEGSPARKPEQNVDLDLLEQKLNELLGVKKLITAKAVSEQ